MGNTEWDVLVATETEETQRTEVVQNLNYSLNCDELHELNCLTQEHQIVFIVVFRNHLQSKIPFALFVSRIFRDFFFYFLVFIKHLFYLHFGGKCCSKRMS